METTFGAYLSDVGHKEVGENRTEDTERTGDEEGVLASADRVRCPLLGDGENISAHKCPDLTHGRCNPVVLASDGGCTGLGCQKTDVVSRAQLTKRQENSGLPLFLHRRCLGETGMYSPVNHDEGGNVLRGGQLRVGATHDEANHSLC